MKIKNFLILISAIFIIFAGWLIFFQQRDDSAKSEKIIGHLNIFSVQNTAFARRCCPRPPPPPPPPPRPPFRPPPVSIYRPPPPPPPPPVNGICGGSKYSCSRGSLTNTNQTLLTWVWQCAGSNGGSTADCSYNKPFYSFSVTKTGLGDVRGVRSNSTGSDINCGSVCSSSYVVDTVVNITAIPAPGFVFAGWQGSCSGTSGACSLTMNDVKSVNALFYPVVVVDKSSSRAGTIVSSPAGINCGAGCVHAVAGFPQNSSVTLTATPSSGYRLAGWRGACDFKSSGPCVLTANAPKITLAMFEVSLSVGKTGAGSGVVVGPGIECGADCSEYYPDGFFVPVLANPFVDSVFARWQGACAGVPDKVCLVPMDAAKTATAVFDLLPFLFRLPPSPPAVSVTKKASTVIVSNNISQTLVSGTAKPVTLSVSGLPSGVTVSINNNFCKAPCTSALNFSVSPDASTGIFPITVTGQADNVSTTTRFNMLIGAGGIYGVRVVKSGTGSGAVKFVSNDPKNWQVSCELGVSSSTARPPACSNIYARNSNITITAAPDAGSAFTGWGGDCGGTGTCVISNISGNKNVTVNFKKQ